MELHLSLYPAIFLFLLSAMLIWYFSNRLSDVVNFIDDHFSLGDAFGGTIMLAVVTNLPEIAITLNGAIKGDVAIAEGNLLGGILIQTVLLVIFDFFSRKNDNRPLSTLFNAPSSRLQVWVLAILLSLIIIGTQFDITMIWWRVSPIEMLILLIWVAGLLVVKKIDKKNTPSPNQKDKRTEKKSSSYTATSAFFFLGLIAIVILVFGLLLEVSSSIIAAHYHIDGLIFGASILALATSLPELSGGLEFVKQKTYKPIVSDIFGGNAFLLLLFIPITFISRRSSLSFLSGVYIYFAWFGLVMTLVYICSMGMWSSSKRYGGMGWDSWIVLALYICCLVGLLDF